MTDKTLEQGAREAAEELSYKALDAGMEVLRGYQSREPDLTAPERSCICEAALSGYLAAATLRDKEIEALLARVAELERMVPRWVLENESALLNEQGWSVSETDKLGNGPRLWLMVPPIPLPEGEG